MRYIFTKLIFSFKFISLCLFNEIDGTWCIYVHADHHLTQIGEYGISAYIFSNLHEMCLFMGPLEAYTLKTINNDKSELVMTDNGNSDILPLLHWLPSNDQTLLTLFGND